MRAIAGPKTRKLRKCVWHSSPRRGEPASPAPPLATPMPSSFSEEKGSIRSELGEDRVGIK